MRVQRAMLLQDLFSGIDTAAPAITVTGLSANSRQLAPGALFLACAGLRNHGLKYLDAALSAGARAVAWEPAAGVEAPVVPGGVSAFAVPGLARLQGTLADRFFGAPSKEMAVTGITGTNGKTKCGANEI